MLVEVDAREEEVKIAAGNRVSLTAFEVLVRVKVSIEKSGGQRHMELAR